MQVLEQRQGRLVLLIIAAGLVFRFAFLWGRQLETDELMQALVARSHSIAEMLDRLKGGIILAAPLDYVIQKGLVSILGECTWALRVHAALFGSLSIWIFCRIARQLFNSQVAVYSTFLFAFFPLHYHYSQEARPYALFVLLTLLSYDLLIRLAAGSSRGRLAWLGLCGVLSLLLYSSFLGILVILSQLAALILLAWGSRRAPGRAASDTEDTPLFESVGGSFVWFYLAAALTAGLIFLPWARFAWRKPEVASITEVLNFRLILRVLKELGDGSYAASALILAGVGTGVRTMKRHGQQRALSVLLLWSCLSLPILLAIEIWSGYYFAIRDILHAIPPLILIAGYGLSYIGEQMAILDHIPRKVSSPSIGYAVLLLLVSVWVAQSHWRKEPVDWKGTAEFLQSTARQGDKMTMVKTYPLLEYYAPSLASYRSGDLDPGPGRLIVEQATRRLVVCLDQMPRNPCGAFRKAASGSTAWRKVQRGGFTIFMRER